MKFENSQDYTLANGTSLQGYILTTYDNLVKIFGEPWHGPDSNLDDKVTCEWAILFDDGTVATIYDYKIGFTPRDEYEWHVGGMNKNSLELIENVLAEESTYG